MRPITLWDSRAILAYFPKPAAEKLRYMIVRAEELKLAGVADGDNGFFQAVDEIQVAISTELTDAGFTPTTLVAPVALEVTATDTTELDALQVKFSAQEDELIVLDDEVARLQAEIDTLKAGA